MRAKKCCKARGNKSEFMFSRACQSHALAIELFAEFVVYNGHTEKCILVNWHVQLQQHSDISHLSEEGVEPICFINSMENIL